MNRTNEYGQIAITKKEGFTFYYYTYKDMWDIDKIFRISDEGQMTENPEWDWDILSEDLTRGYELEYISEDIAADMKAYHDDESILDAIKEYGY